MSPISPTKFEECNKKMDFGLLKALSEVDKNGKSYTNSSGIDKKRMIGLAQEKLGEKMEYDEKKDVVTLKMKSRDSCVFTKDQMLKKWAEMIISHYSFNEIVKESDIAKLRKDLIDCVDDDISPKTVEKMKKIEELREEFGKQYQNKVLFRTIHQDCDKPEKVFDLHSHIMADCN